MNWREFEEFSTKVMEEHFGAEFTEKNPKGFPKRFDMVSNDEQIVGDAKYLTLVRGVKLPPAKLMEITGHVWLLEKLPAKRKFLVFGNQREVPELWLKKYGKLVTDVEFYFLSDDGKLELLSTK